MLQSKFFSLCLRNYVLMCVTRRVDSKFMTPKGKPKAKKAVVPSDDELPAGDLSKCVFFPLLAEGTADECYRLVSEFIAPKGKAKVTEAVVLSEDEMPEFSEYIFPLHLQNVVADGCHSIISEIVASKNKAKVASKGKTKAKEAVELSDGEMPEFPEYIFSPSLTKCCG